MAQTIASRQFSFRLPAPLVRRVEKCANDMRATGLEITRADVVRLLLKHALDSTHCRFEALLAPASTKKRPRPRRH